MITNWKIDTVHSFLGFRIKMLGISAIRGSFNEYQGNFAVSEDNWETAQIKLEAPVSGIHTGNTLRDEHLQGDYWLDAEKHPNFIFESVKIKKKKDGLFNIKGNLTLKGQTHPIVLKMILGGMATDKNGIEKVGFSGFGSINREAYGIAPGLALPNGETFLGKNIKIRFDIQLTK